MKTKGVKVIYWFGSGGGGGNVHCQMTSCDGGFVSDESVDGDESLLLLLILDVCLNYEW